MVSNECGCLLMLVLRAVRWSSVCSCTGTKTAQTHAPRLLFWLCQTQPNATPLPDHNPRRHRATPPAKPSEATDHLELRDAHGCSTSYHSYVTSQLKVWRRSLLGSTRRRATHSNLKRRHARTHTLAESTAHPPAGAHGERPKKHREARELIYVCSEPMR